MQKDGFGPLGLCRHQNPFVQLLYDFGVFVFELDRLLTDINAQVEEESSVAQIIYEIHDLIAGDGEYDVNFLIQTLDVLEHYLEVERSKCKDERKSDSLLDFVSRLEKLVSK